MSIIIYFAFLYFIDNTPHTNNSKIFAVSVIMMWNEALVKIMIANSNVSPKAKKKYSKGLVPSAFLVLIKCFI